MGCSASGAKVVEPRRTAPAPAGAVASAPPRRSFAGSETVCWRPIVEAHTTAVNECPLEAECIGTVEENYDFHTELGKGAMGTVKLAVSRSNNEMVAVKCMKTKASKFEDEPSDTEREIMMMARLSHKNIIRFTEGFETARQTYVVMELCTGGEVFDRIKELGRFSERDAANVLQQMSSAVAYMHSRFICHRDLKPENFMFASDESVATNTVKLVDFGLACQFTPGKPMKEALGTPMYMAPEVLRKNYTEKCDVWSLGCILYVMLRGSLPYTVGDPNLLQKVKKGSYKKTIGSKWERTSSDAKRLIGRMMQTTVFERYSAEEVLQHGWIQRYATSSRFVPAAIKSSVSSATTQDLSDVASESSKGLESERPASRPGWATPVGTAPSSSSSSRRPVHPEPTEESIVMIYTDKQKKPQASRRNNWVAPEDTQIATILAQKVPASPAFQETTLRSAAFAKCDRSAPRVGICQLGLPGSVEDYKSPCNASLSSTRCSDSWLSNSDVEKEAKDAVASHPHRLTAKATSRTRRPPLSTLVGKPSITSISCF